MDTIQAMRKKAMDAGFLKSDANQKVTTNTEGQTEIQPTNPETVYVQNYVPSEAYGSDWDHHDDDDYWDYSGIVTAPAWPWRGRNVAAFALGYRCGWNNGGLGYNSNYYNGSFYKDNLKGKNIDPANREWVHDQANARSLSSNAQQAAGRLDNRTAQNFNKGDSANSKNLKQDLQDRDRTQAAKSALQNADRAQVANKAQNSDRVQSAKADLAASNKATPGGARTEAAKTAIQNADRAQVANKAQNSARVQNAKTAAQTQPRPTAKPAISGSSNANAERAYSNRGAQSRSSSAKTVKSHAGSAPKAKASKSGGGNRSGAARR
jgi:hypothetical protein